MKTTRVPTLLTVIALAGCSPSPATTPTAIASVGPTPAATVPPTTAPTVEPRCPEPTEGTQRMENQAMGFCLVYPEDLTQVSSDPTGACLVPGPSMACHSAVASIDVSDAAGRTAAQIADEMIADAEAVIPGIAIQRSEAEIAGQPAVVVEGLPGVASSREIFVVNADRLYRLIFLLPDAESASADLFERLFNTIVDSFTLIPTSPSPASTEAGQGTRGSAVVAYIKDGSVLVWEETTGESRTVFDAGDVTRVELSDDGQLVAFVRRTLLDGDLRYGRSSLWVVDRDGANPRELVSDAQLRARLGASETDDTDFPELAWIPSSHRLLYSVMFFPAYIYAQGVYLVDADTLAGAELVPITERADFAGSPDGVRVALLSDSGPFFVNVEDALSGEMAFTNPAGGIPGPGQYILGAGSGIPSLKAWTQDSAAVIIKGPIVSGGNLSTRWTVWLVPADGAAVEPLFTLNGDHVELAPDGSVLAFVRGAGPGGPSGRFVVPLPEDLGPLALNRDPISLSWSPAGTAYVIGWEEMTPLCPNAAQAIEVCGPPVDFGEPVGPLEWIDRERFVYLVSVPNRLLLGSLDGSRTVIAEDPRVLPNASSESIAAGFAGVASTCTDDSEFVEDVTVPDGTPFAPNTLFQKTWRVRNTGDCAWDASYRLTFLSGDRMSGPRSAALGEPVLPGEDVALSVTLIAPSEEGTYQGQWQLFAPDGTPFGARPFVSIVVP
jgi:hypothetical protein